MVSCVKESFVEEIQRYRRQSASLEVMMMPRRFNLFAPTFGRIDGWLEYNDTTIQMLVLRYSNVETQRKLEK